MKLTVTEHEAAKLQKACTLVAQSWREEGRLDEAELWEALHYSILRQRIENEARKRRANLDLYK